MKRILYFAPLFISLIAVPHLCAELILDIRPIQFPQDTLWKHLKLAGRVRMITYIEKKAYDLGGGLAAKFKPIRHITIEMDVAGRLTKASWFIADELDFAKTFAEMPDGIIKEVVSEASKNTSFPIPIGSERIWSYDSTQRISTGKWTGSAAGLSPDFSIVYDPTGNPVREALLKVDGTESMSTELNWTKEGLLKSTSSSFGDVTFEYDSQGRPSKKTALGSSEHYRYDSTDEKGNWIRRLDYHREEPPTDQLPDYAVDRTIEYFP